MLMFYQSCMTNKFLRYMSNFKFIPIFHIYDILYSQLRVSSIFIVYFAFSIVISLNIVLHAFIYFSIINMLMYSNKSLNL